MRSGETHKASRFRHYLRGAISPAVKVVASGQIWCTANGLQWEATLILLWLQGFSVMLWAIGGKVIVSDHQLPDPPQMKSKVYPEVIGFKNMWIQKNSFGSNNLSSLHDILISNLAQWNLYSLICRSLSITISNCFFDDEPTECSSVGWAAVITHLTGAARQLNLANTNQIASFQLLDRWHGEWKLIRLFGLVMTPYMKFGCLWRLINKTFATGVMQFDGCWLLSLIPLKQRFS